MPRVYAVNTVPTIRFDIFMAGDVAQAKHICRQYCFEVGLCVHVEPVDFIYTGGEESGFKVGFINYPRFPLDESALREHAVKLGLELMEGLFQHSFSVVGPTTTEWFSRRPE